MCAELADAAVEAKHRLLGPLRLALVTVEVRYGFLADADGQARHQVGGLPGSLGERIEAELGVLNEHLAVRPEPDPGPGGPPDSAALSWAAELAQPRLPGEVRVRAGPGELAGDAAAEAGRPGVSLPVHLDVQPRGQRVDDRGADAVQAARGRIRAAAELAARVQPGHHQLHAGELGLALDVDRDAAAVVPDLGRTIRVQRHLDPGAVPGQRLVHGVVEDLPQAVLEAAAVRRPDVHAGALADRLQALEDRQVPGGVSVSRSSFRGRPGRGEGGHSRPISLREIGRGPHGPHPKIVAFRAGCPSHATRRAAMNPRLTMTNASTTAIWVHVRLETHGACVLPVLPPSTGGTQASPVRWRQLRPRSVGEWFRLWRTPLGVGNADAGVCVVLSCKGRKPEPAGYYRPEARREGRRR